MTLQDICIYAAFVRELVAGSDEKKEMVARISRVLDLISSRQCIIPGCKCEGVPQ